jgi:hypothetical protein
MQRGVFLPPNRPACRRTTGRGCDDASCRSKPCAIDRRPRRLFFSPATELDDERHAVAEHAPHYCSGHETRESIHITQLPTPLVVGHAGIVPGMTSKAKLLMRNPPHPRGWVSAPRVAGVRSAVDVGATRGGSTHGAEGPRGGATGLGLGFRRTRCTVCRAQG